jgi:hypothetical protein
MHQSSEAVAALASALAKAQTEQVNREKSLTATIRSGRPGEGSPSPVVEIMVDRTMRGGSASGLLRLCAETGADVPAGRWASSHVLE